MSPPVGPQKTTSIPGSRRPARSSSGASGVPAQRALPTPPIRKGRPVLPEHSRVKVTSWRGRAGGRRGSAPGPRDEAADPQAPVRRVHGWLAVVADDEELVGRRQPGVELLPDQLRGRCSGRGWPRAGRARGGPRRPAGPGRRARGRPAAARTARPAPRPRPATGCGETFPASPLSAPFVKRDSDRLDVVRGRCAPSASGYAASVVEWKLALVIPRAGRQPCPPRRLRAEARRRSPVTVQFG